MKDYKNIAIDNTTSSDNKLYGKIGKLIKIIVSGFNMNKLKILIIFIVI